MGSHSGSELSADSAAQLEGFSIDEDGGVWMRLPSGQRTLLGSDQHVIRDEPSQSSHWVHEERHGAAAGLRDGVVLASVVLFLFHLRLDAVDGGGYIVTRLSTEAFGSICLSCSVRTWKMVHYSLFFSSCIWQSLLVRLGVTVIGFSGDPGVTRAKCLVRQWLHVLRSLGVY